MKNYLNLLKRILDEGSDVEDRTGVGTRFISGSHLEFDLDNGFPICTSKKTNFHAIIVELLWFLRGETNIKFLKDNGVKIWNEWADENGDLGPVYGHQWRNFNGQGIDQIKNVIKSIKEDSASRRHIVCAWNPAQIEEMNLPPCHILFNFIVENGRLNCHLFQRSVDVFLGMPFNIASYSALIHMIAMLTNLRPGKFIHTGSNVHIYKNHIDQVKKQLSLPTYPLPELKIKRNVTDIDDFRIEDFELINYQHGPVIRAPIAV